jgi:ATP-dependent DNA ligase
MILPVRRLSSNGLKPGAQAVHKGYEGLVGKDPESPYVGGRTLKWLKVKLGTKSRTARHVKYVADWPERPSRPTA